ncbi:MAG: CDP-glycerol glycerophosphotransferase family protein [Lachnospiraceae bacterium]|nr:CDP-glycerol glycerophosphotransferase family protein [Lachnospiraceae bacterium]
MIDNKTLIEINTCPQAKNKTEELYIIKRRIKAFGNSLCFYLCRIFPIKRNLVSVCTFEGKGGFGCNPKYIVMELHNQDSNLEFVWFVNKDIIDKKEFPDYIRKVPNTLWSRAYWLSRSMVWIDNYRKPLGTVKRRKQLYINSWHGMCGFKSIGLWRGKSFSKMAYLVSKNDSKMVDYFLSDSDFTDEFFIKGLVYRGEFLKTGSPRCDTLVNKRDMLKEKFYKKQGFNLEDKCIMFAPTYREVEDNGKRSVHSQLWSIDFDAMLKALSDKDGCRWHLILRLHPQIATYYKSNMQYIDVTMEDDMYEILGAMDALVTDYSSCAMDAAIMEIPVFIYADDIEKYKYDRGVFTWLIDEKSRHDVHINKMTSPNIDAILPFSVAKNNDELREDIEEFDEALYKKRLNKYEKNIGLIKHGMASKQVAAKIKEWIK